MVRVGQVETVSLQQDFYRQLGKIRNQYSWQIDEDNNIVAQRGRTTYNPVTALAKWYGHTSVANNKRETVRVGRQLGLPRQFVEHVYDATTSVSNRGNAQVVRGKIRSALEI